MTSKEAAALDERLDHFLADVTGSLGRSERHHWAKIYLQGLLMEYVLSSLAYEIRNGDNLKFEYRYQDGKKEAEIFKDYSENGKLYREVNYKDGESYP